MNKIKKTSMTNFQNILEKKIYTKLKLRTIGIIIS